MGARPITDTLRDLRNGRTLEELTDRMQELVEAVVRTGKAGSLTLKLTLRPSTPGDGAGPLLLLPDVKATLPKDMGSSVFFATPENNLTKQGPAQPSLDLREIAGGAAGVRDIAAPASAARGLA